MARIQQCKASIECKKVFFDLVQDFKNRKNAERREDAYLKLKKVFNWDKI